MPETYTTGTWRVAAAKEDAFVEAWAEFARWASEMPGAGTLRLTHDSDGDRFVSFGAWESADAVPAWKGASDFDERIARVLQLVDDFESMELTVLATADAGAATVSAAL
jgi:heme-degrading monooxygenase HmoA